MSEHQYVAFRAVDAPVSTKNLEYMKTQSSRAEITPWSFENEYHFGDFRGNALEMLRRGYDVHLHYANFGIRTLFIRLPSGIPDARAAKPYFLDDSLEFVKDKAGRGGTIRIAPFQESGDLEGIWEFDGLIESLLPIRAEILSGDLRPLYLAHLAVASDGNHDPEKEYEAPVPAGLKKLSDAQSALAEFYGLSNSLIAAAARKSPPMESRTDPSRIHAQWIQGLPQAKKDAWLTQLLADPHARVRIAMIADFLKNQDVLIWPTVPGERTISQLEAAAEEIEKEWRVKSAEKAARAKGKRLAAMAADPAPTLCETEKLVKHRTEGAYIEIAKLLEELREALAGTDRHFLAEEQAMKLKKGNPTRAKLTSALRRKGFLTK